MVIRNLNGENHLFDSDSCQPGKQLLVVNMLLCGGSVSRFERQRISDLLLKRERRKAGVDNTSPSHSCTIGERGCAAATGLYLHI